MPTAVKIIKDEHRSIAAVLEGLVRLTAEIRCAQRKPDFTLLRAIVRYIEAFPERLHHPKEDAYIFARLRIRRPDVAPLLDALETEHVEGTARLGELHAALDRYEQVGPVAFPPFERNVASYADFHWAHMRKEEDEVLPLALKALVAADWREIDAAFESNDDPLVGIRATKASRELFRRIVNLAPPPIGVGPPRN